MENKYSTPALSYRTNDYIVKYALAHDFLDVHQAPMFKTWLEETVQAYVDKLTVYQLINEFFKDHE